ncbi:sugar ABC transporter permease [Deinococcus sp.]|uniref:carbohydrate ABC transporter permease n=1 Tax=Deinococcus sp. TaxID=47478 RepID=UPI00286E704B|nr:sugar ABC transporter permease [Deinococcus sp.]
MTTTNEAVLHARQVKQARSDRFRPYFVLAPAFLLTIGILIPFFVAIYLSLTDISLRSQNFSFVGLSNYAAMFRNPDFYHAVGVSLRYSLWTTGVEMLLGLGVAMLLNEEHRLARVMRLLLTFPLMVAPVIATLIWQLMTSPSVGIVANWLRRIGLGEFQWGAATGSAMFSVVIIDVWVYTPFVIILVLAGLRGLPAEPYEAASIDGAGPLTVFRSITLPMITPFLLIALIFRLMLSLQEFGIIFALTKGGPGDALVSMSLYSYQQGFQFYDLAKSIPVMFLLYLVVYVAANFLINSWRRAQSHAAGE